MPLHAAHVIEDDLLLKADLSGHLVRLPCGVFSPRVDPRPCGGLACIFAVLVVPVVLAIVGYQFMKRMAFNLVDEVFDLGDALLVRKGGQEERIALADIKNLVAAAAERVWRHGCVLCADADDAAVAKPDHRKAYRPN